MAKIYKRFKNSRNFGIFVYSGKGEAIPTQTHIQTQKHTVQSMQNKMENKIKKSYEDINYKNKSTNHCLFYLYLPLPPPPTLI